MNRGWTIGKKLVVSFMSVACITLFLGVIGYYGLIQMEQSIDEIGMVRLPSVASIGQVQVELEIMTVALRSLLYPRNTLEQRRVYYDRIQRARQAYRAAMDIYEPLPQRDDEAREWNEFTRVLPEWGAVNDNILAMHREFDEIGILDPGELIENLQQFRGDHYAVEMQVVNQLFFNREFEGGDDHTACNFGRWLAGFSTDNRVLRTELNEIARHHQAFHAAVGRIRQAMNTGDRDEAIRIFNEIMQPAAEETFAGFYRMIAEAERADELFERVADLTMGRGYDLLRQGMGLLGRVVEINNEIADEEMAAAHRQAGFLETLSLVAAIIGVLAAVILGLLISRSISSAIQAIAASLGSGGDQVASASNQVSSSSQQMAEGASEQASNLEEVSSSLEEMSSMTRQNADNAQQGNLLMTETGTLVEKGQGSMTRLAAAIEEIKSSADQTAKIVKTIDEIAFQTNLLALNAAVEAARAGEAGKGFAVVAEEVRNLAQRAGEAARNTATLIEGSVKNAERGVEVASETKQSFDDIAISSGKVSGLVAEISAASNEQARGIDQLNEAMSQLDQVTQENAANSEESSSAAEELSAQAKELNDMVKELLAMVDSSAGQSNSFGGGGAMNSGRSASTGRAPARKQMAIGGHSGHAGTRKMTVAAKAPVGGAINKGKVVKPQDVIPLDDDDFKDF